MIFYRQDFFHLTNSLPLYGAESMLNPCSLSRGCFQLSRLHPLDLTVSLELQCWGAVPGVHTWTHPQPRAPWAAPGLGQWPRPARVPHSPWECPAQCCWSQRRLLFWGQDKGWSPGVGQSCAAAVAPPGAFPTLAVWKQQRSRMSQLQPGDGWMDAGSLLAQG